MTQSGANCYPSKDSLLAGKNAGKIPFLRLRKAKTAEKVLAASILLTKFPTHQSRENCSSSRENLVAMQTNLAQRRSNQRRSDTRRKSRWCTITATADQHESPDSFEGGYLVRLVLA
jgi:hypothetical protein